MAVTYIAALKTARMQRTADRIATMTDAVATGSPTTGTLVIGTSGLSGATGVLATFTITTAVTSGVSGSVLTIPLSASSVTASASGTAALAEIRNNAGTVIVSGLTVGTSATDVILNSTTITSGQTVTISAATLTHG
jgi:hypothetical protein